MPHKNKEDRKEYQKQWYQKDKERLKEKQKQWNINNKENRKEISKQYYQNNKEEALKNQKQYNIENKEKILKYKKKYITNRLRIDSKFNLNFKISHAIRLSLKGNKSGRHWEDLVGYTSNDLHRRLLQTMPIGYTWQDYMEGRLHIDHIIPVVAFNFTKPEHTDFQRCWALDNLRLLPAEENLRKHAKLFRPFQPALAF